MTTDGHSDDVLAQTAELFTPARIAEKYGVDVASVRKEVELARRYISPHVEQIDVLDRGERRALLVTREAVGPIKVSRFSLGLSPDPQTKEFERFYLFDFNVTPDPWQKYAVVVHGRLCPRLRVEVPTERPVVLRIDSGCVTGQVFHDATCECREQLLKAMRRISSVELGLIINIPRQDGRGMGLPFKLATLELQDTLGVNTVESSALLEPDSSRDKRTYGGVIAILRYLGVPETAPLIILTNNAEKLAIFGENGYSRVTPEAVIIPPTTHTRHHLEAKERHLGHRLSLKEDDE